MKKALLWTLLPVLLAGLAGGCAANRARKVEAMKQQLPRQMQVGQSYVQRGDLRSAYRHYTNAVRLYSRYGHPLRTETARLYVERGKVALAMKYPKKAEVDFNQAKRLCPGIRINVSGTGADVMLPSKENGQEPPPPPPGPDGNGSEEPPPPPPDEPEIEKVKIAILDFEEPPATRGKGYGTSFANMMTNEMSRARAFTVVERSILDKIMQERNLSQTELLAKAQEGGEEGKRILSVRYLLYGSITVEGNAVTVTARLIDWGSGRTVLSDMSKRLVGQGTSPSYYFDEIARDLGRKLEDGYVRVAGNEGE